MKSWIISWSINHCWADVYQHTGTWSGYDETDHGRFQYGTSAMDGTHNSWLRARWFANDAADRITRVMEGAAATDPMIAQVKMSEAMADLMIGMTFCESPLVASGPTATDTQNLEQAVANFGEAIAAAKAANNSEFELASVAGLAQAHLLLGNYASAAAEAAKIPAGFSYDAVFNEEDRNWVVLVTGPRASMKLQGSCTSGGRRSTRPPHSHPICVIR